MARSIRLLSISLVGVAAVAHAEACGVDDGLSSFVDDDAGRSIDRGDASALGDDAGPSLATLRLAHLAPEVGTIDFCYAARTGSLEGPVLRGGGTDPDASVDAGTDAGDAALDAQNDAASDASAPGLAYGTVTKYFTLQETGTIKVAIVRAGAATCANPIAEGTVTVDPGKLSTVGLFAGLSADAGDAGDGGTAFSLLAFIDDRSTEPDRARVRMIHAARGDALAVRAGETVIAERLDSRKVSAASKAVPVDELGFATVVPVPPPASFVITPILVDGGPAGASWRSAPVDLDLRGDSLHTGFVLDGPDAGFEVLWCADKTTTAELTACQRVR